MKKIFLTLSILVVIVITIGIYKFNFNNSGDIVSNPVATDYKNATYSIGGYNVHLINGKSEIEIAPGSASKIITQYFGNEVVHDLNGDGRPDIAFLVTQTTGGSGVFYYVVTALNTEKGYVGSQGLFLGDRIAPQTTEIGKGNIIIVNYADRAVGESFAVQPSIGKSLYLLLDTTTMQFGEVVQNFEGEADPSKMTLDMKKWEWVKTIMNDGKITNPKKTGLFTLTFNKNGKVSVGTDCNKVSGSYSTKDKTLTFNSMMSTMMYCDGSQEGEFLQTLNNVGKYLFTNKGELILEVKMDSGSVVFR